MLKLVNITKQFTGGEVVTTALNNGADEFLMKPFTPESLRENAVDSPQYGDVWNAIADAADAGTDATAAPPEGGAPDSPVSAACAPSTRLLTCTSSSSATSSA